MPVITLALPVPPLKDGVSWDGLSLLNWVLENSPAEMFLALMHMRDAVGGDVFRDVWNKKAEELNRRLGSRVLDPRGLPADPQEGLLRVPMKETVM